MCCLRGFWGLLFTSKRKVVVVVQLTLGRTHLRRHRRVSVQPQVPREQFEFDGHRLRFEVLHHSMERIRGDLALRLFEKEGRKKRTDERWRQRVKGPTSGDVGSGSRLDVHLGGRERRREMVWGHVRMEHCLCRSAILPPLPSLFLQY